MPDKYTISLPTFNECLSGTGLRKVLSNSESIEKQALEEFAVYFKREMHYDNVQYEAENHDVNCIGFLFTENAMDICTDEHIGMPSRCVGGCCFRQVKGTWVLCWVWFHPFCRDRGLLSRHWKVFVSDFGSFSIEAPLSPSMESFLKKQSSNHNLVRIS